MPEKPRIKNWLTRYLMPFKVFVWSLPIAFSLVLFYRVYRDGFRATIWPLAWVFLLYRAYLINKKLYHVEFDEDFLYVVRRDADLLVPLENIKDINLISMLGHWEIIFYNAEQLVDKNLFQAFAFISVQFKNKRRISECFVGEY